MVIGGFYGFADKAVSLCSCVGNDPFTLRLRTALKKAVVACGRLPEPLAAPGPWPSRLRQLIAVSFGVVSDAALAARFGQETLDALSERCACLQCQLDQEWLVVSVDELVQNISAAAEDLRLREIVLRRAAKRAIRSDDEYMPVELLRAITAGTDLGGRAESLISRSLPSAALRSGVLKNPGAAALANTFCSDVATLLLQHRTIALAAYVAWLGGFRARNNYAADRTAIWHTLAVAADFFRPPLSISRLALPDRIEGWYQVEVPVLILHVSTLLPHALINVLLKELRKSLDSLSAGTVHIIWMETLHSRHAPQVVQEFGTIGGEIETIWSPFFGLHASDDTVWLNVPSLAHIRCSASPRCWIWDVPDRPLPRPPEVPGAPREPGCWVRTPNGCPNDPSLLSEWRRDTWGERNANARVDQDVCLSTRKLMYDSWCGITDTEMHFFTLNAAPEVPSNVPSVGDVLAELSSLQAKNPSSFHEALTALPQIPKEILEDGAWRQAWASYLERHSSAVRRSAESGGVLDIGERCVVWACHPLLPCGGHGDRLKGILATFVLALLTDRLFFLDAPDPWDVRLFLEPGAIDWRLASGLRGRASGRYVMWDYDEFDSETLDGILGDEGHEERVWTIYTNKKSFLGPLLRHPALRERARALRLLSMPNLARQAWQALFKPTAALEQEFQHLQSTLLGGEGVPYVALHYRAGDWRTFGVINGEKDERASFQDLIRILTCANHVEQQLGLPNTTRWYLAADDETALHAPQVETWRETGKLVSKVPYVRKTHIAAAGVTPPEGATKAHDENGASLLSAAASLAGTVDAWLEFLVLSRAYLSVLSSSAFGIVAAQVGGVPFAFSPHGCVRMDLLQ